MTSEHVLITGGAGFIGSRLSANLASRGHEVTVLDNLSPQVHGEDVAARGTAPWLPHGARFVLGDVRDQAAWDLAYTGQSIVIHLAAETGTGQSMYQTTRYCDVNVNGTARLLDLLTAEGHAVRKVVIASSRSIYGEGRYQTAAGEFVYPASRNRGDLEAGVFDPQLNGAPLTAVSTDEESKVHPSSVYGITKATQEQLVLQGCAALGVSAASLRYQNVYGPGQSLRNPYTGILSIFSNLILSGAPINIFEDGAESRDFVYVDDVVRATTLAAESELVGQDYYNVGSGVATTVLDVVRELGDALGIEPDSSISGAFRVGDIRHNWAETTKIEKALGFSASVDFSDGVRELCAWARGEPRTDTRAYTASLSEMRAKGLMG
jgi:dTDP-L-rhamnose 4-epimerase